MAFPVVETTAESSTNTAGANHVITLPSGIAAGDLILICLDKGSTAATVNAHADYTELLDENAGNGLYIAYRWATGSESNPTLVTSANTRTATIAFRISGAENPATRAPEIGTTATGTSATPDPPSVTPTGGAKDYLWIAVAGMAGEEADDDTWGNTPPTNFTPSPPLQKSCGVAGTNLGGLILAASRQANAASQDPGTFGVDASAAWRAQTIAVHPSSSVPHSHNQPDSLAGTDAVVKAATRSSADTGSLSDSVSQAWAATRQHDDALSGTDAVAKTVATPVADAATVTDGITLSPGRAVQIDDSISGTDALTKTATVARTESLTGADARVVSAAVVLTDSATATDASTRRPAVTFTDTASVTDGITTDAGGTDWTQPINDTLSVTDTVGKIAAHVLADPVVMTDAVEIDGFTYVSAGVWTYGPVVGWHYVSGVAFVYSGGTVFTYGG